MTKLGVVVFAYTFVPTDPSPLHLLLARRCGSPPDKIQWVTVGGGVEPMESLGAAALRELREEVGLGGSFRGVTNHISEIMRPDTNSHKVLIHTVVEVHEPWPHLEESPELFEIQWVPLRNLNHFRLGFSPVTAQSIDDLVPKLLVRGPQPPSENVYHGPMRRTLPAHD